jgi:integrase
MTPLLDAYLALRRAAGYKLKSAESRLRCFVRFAAKCGDTHIRAETVRQWAGMGASAEARYGRLHAVIPFARHMRAEDPVHEVPSEQLYPFKKHRRLPYIYSDDEIRRLLETAGKLRPRGTSRSDTYRTLLGLLISTGLRIGEALSLQMRDLTTDGLVVRNTKFRKSRLVALHSTTVKALNVYRERWRALARPEDPLLASSTGTRLPYSTVMATARGLLQRLKIRPAQPPPGLRRVGPCLHDMRHSFAVRALESCPSGRTAINQHMLALSTYLGHGSVADTYWYLQATPQLMTDIADACEATFLGGAR